MIRITMDETPINSLTSDRVEAMERALATIEALAEMRGVSASDEMPLSELVRALGGRVECDGAIVLPEPWDGGA